MQTHPAYAHFLASDRTGDIARQVKHNYLAQSLRVLERAQNGQSPARLSLASLRGLVGFGNGRAVQGHEMDGAASHPDLVKPLNPEEQCC